MLSGNLRHSAVHKTIQRLQKHWNTKTNLLFLDFDGVFIIPRKEKDSYLERISQLCLKYHLKAVITSTWRLNMDTCTDMLIPYGINVIGRTELEGKDRNIQILNYLKTHPFHHFIILDDMFLESFQDYAVQCDFYTGFDESAYQKAIQLLEHQIEEEEYNLCHR